MESGGKYTQLEFNAQKTIFSKNKFGAQQNVICNVLVKHARKMASAPCNYLNGQFGDSFRKVKNRGTCQ